MTDPAPELEDELDPGTPDAELDPADLAEPHPEEQC